MRVALGSLVLLVAACDCARPLEGGIYACEPDGTCPAGEACVSGLCVRTDAGAGGGSGGGGTSGGGAGGGGMVPNDGGCSAQPDPIDDLGADTNCDGVDGVAAESIFVDPLRGAVGGTGLPTDPVRDLTTGLDRAANSPGKTRLLVAEGTTLEPSTVLTTRFSIYGGYSRSDGGWPRDRMFGGCGDGGRPLVLGAAIAMRTEADASVTLESLCVQAADADAGASIALAVVNSRALVTLREVELNAGRGATHGPAPMGTFGPDGPSGVPGVAAIINGNSILPGGDGGISSCGVSATRGGIAPPGGSAFNAGGDGLDISGGSQGGTHGNAVNDDCNISCACGMASSPATDGESGDGGRDGLPGLAGNGLGTIDPQLLWLAVNGTSGDAGTGGRAGAGGGGSGTYRLRSGYAFSGASGGGGGAGGCPGSGGGGGRSGGASIGLLLINSRPTLADRVVVSALAGGNGVMGGPGGAGGMGGRGADGGAGGMVWCSGSGTLTTDGGTMLLPGPLADGGGRGGDGSPGGRGGNGGPGGGGPAIAVWCAGDAGYLGSTAMPPNVVLNMGTPGTGVGAAANGTNQQRLGCTP